jgi:hypothetical protein
MPVKMMLAKKMMMLAGKSKQAPPPAVAAAAAPAPASTAPEAADDAPTEPSDLLPTATAEAPGNGGGGEFAAAPAAAVPPKAIPPKSKMPVKLLMMAKAKAAAAKAKLAPPPGSAPPPPPAPISSQEEAPPAASEDPTPPEITAEAPAAELPLPEAATSSEAPHHAGGDSVRAADDAPQKPSAPAPRKLKTKMRPVPKKASEPPSAGGGGVGMFASLVKNLVVKPTNMIANVAKAALNAARATASELVSSSEKPLKKEQEEAVAGAKEDLTQEVVQVPDEFAVGNAASDAATTIFGSATNDDAATEASRTVEGDTKNDVAEMSEAPQLQGLPVVFKEMTEIDYIAKIDFLENQLVRNETHIAKLTEEGRRLKENLYEREGPRVAEHMMELERQVRELTHQLRKERDGVEYHRLAHLQALDELTKMHKIFSENGDFKRCIEENMHLRHSVAELTQVKAEQAMRIDELERQMVVIDQREGKLAAKGKSPYVHIRRAGLCATCLAAVESQEEYLERKLLWERSQAVMPVPPLLSQPWHTDPVVLMAQPVQGIDHHKGILAKPAPGARGWRELVTPTGQVVYHNIITNQSTLQKPAELVTR